MFVYQRVNYIKVTNQHHNKHGMGQTLDTFLPMLRRLGSTNGGRGLLWIHPVDDLRFHKFWKQIMQFSYQHQQHRSSGPNRTQARRAQRRLKPGAAQEKGAAKGCCDGAPAVTEDLDSRAPDRCVFKVMVHDKTTSYHQLISSWFILIPSCFLDFS